MGFYSSLLDHVSVWYFLGTLGLAGLSNFLLKLYRARSTMLKLKSQGLVRPPYARICRHLTNRFKAYAPL